MVIGGYFWGINLTIISRCVEKAWKLVADTFSKANNFFSNIWLNACKKKISDSMGLVSRLILHLEVRVKLVLDGCLPMTRD